MMKRIIYSTLLVSLVVSLAACEDKSIPGIPDDDVARVDNLPVNFEISIGDVVSSRSVEGAKTEFSAGDSVSGKGPDVIHVQSTYQLKDGSSVTRYCAMEYTEEGTWTPMGEGFFSWPNDATSGTFTAYYIPELTGSLTGNVDDSGAAKVTQIAFSDIYDGGDPLRADDEGVRYGHTVKLEFRHILTRLTLIELAAGLDDHLAFSIDPETAARENKSQFYNGYEIKLGAEANGDPKIEFGYVSIPSQLSPSGRRGMYIKSPTVRVRDRVTREETSEAGFFLAPNRRYNAFDIYFSNGDRYLSYVNSDPNDRDRLLEENNRYYFNVRKSAGVTVSTPPQERWDESDDFTTVVDAEGFLRAVNTNSAYSEYDPEKQETVEILEATTNPSGTLLKRNIRFKTPYYHVFPHPSPDPDKEGTSEPYDFVPSLGSDNVFDGGYHYIKDLACPLFFQNNGTIKNVGFSGVDIGGDTYGPWESSMNFYKEKNENTQYVNAPYAYQYTGAIVTYNNGTVQNIRVKDIKVQVGIHATSPVNADQETHNVGSLFGVNYTTGIVEKIYLSGKIEVVVDLFPGENIVPEVIIGGIVGQNLGTMTEIEQLVDTRENVTSPTPVNIIVRNLLKGGTGAYYIGGVAGNNTGLLSEVNLPTAASQGGAITVDGTQSQGMLSYMGGIAGMAESSQGNQISSCLIASGSVTAGTTSKSGDTDAYSFTGGLVGSLHERTSVFNCTAFLNVKGSTGTGSGISRATGGAFGAILPIQSAGMLPGTMTAIAVYGDTLEGTNAGCFVGEAPLGKTWEDYKDKADVKKFPTLDYIGINADY